MPDWTPTACKVPIMERIDALSRDTERLHQVRDDLEGSSNTSLVDLAEKYGLVSDAEKQHLAVDWFTNWWPSAQPVEPVIAAGFKVAVSAAIERNLPMDCYWVSGASEGARGGEGQVEVAVCWSDRQVTVMINTPAPGQSSMPRAELTVDEPILLVKRQGGPGGSIVTERPRHRGVQEN